jgi:hypothetical protein
MARLCRAGVTLRKQIDQRWVARDRRSDGWIADFRHSQRRSFHNPDKHGVVYALDIDENMGRGKERNGATARQLADELVAYAASNLPGAKRILHVVYEDQVASGTYRRWFWKWRGKGYGHTGHIHITFTPAADKNDGLFPLPILARDEVVRNAWSEALGL